MAQAVALEKNLLNFFWRLGVSLDESRDLVQETYLRLWNYREKYHPSAKFSTFLFLIARQVRIDALRRSSRRLKREESWGAETQGVEAPSHARVDARGDVRWAVAKLPEAMQEVIELAVFQDLPYAEVAEILEIPVGTVKSRMSNALRKLKEIFYDERS